MTKDSNLMLIATCCPEQAPLGNDYGCERSEPGNESGLVRTEWPHHQWPPRPVPPLTEESKGSMGFVLTFLRLYCSWKGLFVVFVCLSSEPQIQRQSLAWRWSCGGKPLLPHSKHRFDPEADVSSESVWSLLPCTFFKVPAGPCVLFPPCFLGKQTHTVPCLPDPHLNGNNFPFGNSCLSD